MPVYEFCCNKCNTEFEYLILGKNDVPKCSKCGSKDITKQFSLFGFTPLEAKPLTGFTSSGKTITSSPGSSCSTCGTHNCSTCG